MKKTILWNSVGWLSLFCENCGFQFLRQVLRIALVLLHFKKKKISHSENQPGFQNLEKNLVPWFSGLSCLTNFWTSSFQAQFSQVNSHKSKFFVFHILLLSLFGVLLFSFLFLVFLFCFFSWMENGNYDCPLKQTKFPSNNQESRVTCK
jgi:hypothetical protein